MQEIRDILSVDHILTNDELKYLLYLFRMMYGIEEEIHFEVNKNSQYTLYYDISKDTICINWDLLMDILDKDNIRSSNYTLAFLLLHELNHALQMRRIEKVNDFASFVYRVCFSYIEEFPIPLVTKLKKIIYDEGHDLFPTEINADIMGYLKMLEILRGYDDEYYEIYKGYLENRILSLYNEDIFKHFFERILRIDVIDESYTLEESLLLGLPVLKEIKRDDIIKLIK